MTVLLPGKCCFSKWTDMVDCMPHSWPKSFNIGRMQIVPIHAASFHKHRKFTRARHMWLRLEPNWRLLGSHMYTEWPGIHTYAEINDRLFVNPGRNDNIQDTKSKVRRYSPEYVAPQLADVTLFLEYSKKELESKFLIDPFTSRKRVSSRERELKPCFAFNCF